MEANFVVAFIHLRPWIGNVKSTRGGSLRIKQVHNESDITREVVSDIRYGINDSNIDSEYVKDRTIEEICRKIGFGASDFILWEGYRKKLTVTGLRDEIGLMVWFGNKQTAYRHFISLQIMFNRGLIKSAIYISPTEDEVLLRNEERAKSKGKEPLPGNQNYSSSEDVYFLLESVKEAITVPITIIGIER